jgi:hypothetical protein
MDLEAVSGAATVALTSTIVFLVVAKSWNAISRTISSTPSFSDRIMHEAAQRFRDELERLTSTQSIYLSGALAFVMLFIAAYILRAQELFVGYPSWQLYLQLGFLFLAIGYATYQLVNTFIAKRQVKFVRDANIAVGHQLQQLTANGTRVFHDVATTAGVVDHVVVGQSGLYAINVVARRSGKQGQVEMNGNALKFSNSKIEYPVTDISAKTTRLAKDFRKLLGHTVRVRSVIALPGWKVGDQLNEEHLLVCENTLAMFSGWKDESDHLMNEDVHGLQRELTARCIVS